MRIVHSVHQWTVFSSNDVYAVTKRQQWVIIRHAYVIYTKIELERKRFSFYYFVVFSRNTKYPNFSLRCNIIIAWNKNFANRFLPFSDVTTQHTWKSAVLYSNKLSIFKQLFRSIFLKIVYYHFKEWGLGVRFWIFCRCHVL